MVFTQSDLRFNRFTYIIEDTGVRIIVKRIASSAETFLEFEDIGSKIIKNNTRKLGWLIASILFLVFAAAVFIDRVAGGNVEGGAEIFHLCISIILFCIFLITKKNILFLAQSDNSRAIEFIGTKKYVAAVNDFIAKITSARDAYLLREYATIDNVLPYSQQYNNLVWLYNRGLLDKQQLQDKIAELDGIKPASTSAKPGGDVIQVAGFGAQRYRAIDEEKNDNG